ncbi:hypothetical protein EON63_15635 [archaeon]|nr:MAG: hypothetical protein EON63_15635 [archaeon]
MLVSQDRFTLYRAAHLAGDSSLPAPSHSNNLHWDMNPAWYLGDSEEVKKGMDQMVYIDYQVCVRECTYRTIYQYVYVRE